MVVEKLGSYVALWHEEPVLQGRQGGPEELNHTPGQGHDLRGANMGDKGQQHHRETPMKRSLEKRRKKRTESLLGIC